jgi:phosphoglycolate phosphatase-like HAD superfamily hydrolase
MASIAVRWGYGQPEEWETARGVIDHPNALHDAIASLGL